VHCGPANDASVFYNRGIALQALKRFEQAVPSYGRAIVLRPGYAGSFFNRGNALQALKRFDEALASYDRAITLKPDYAEAFNNRGVALKELKRIDQALENLDRAIALKPDHAGLQQPRRCASRTEAVRRGGSELRSGDCSHARP
jgi:protein O-GlcNAc transferase